MISDLFGIFRVGGTEFGNEGVNCHRQKTKKNEQLIYFQNRIQIFIIIESRIKDFHLAFILYIQ